MTNFALPWLLLEVTGSALQMGIGFAIEMLPYLLLSIPAGVWADRYNRKRLMIAVDLIRMLLILSLPVIHLFAKLTVLEIYGVMVLMSACSALFDAAYGAALPVIIGEKSLVEGNALRSTGASTARILGPVLGGSLIAWLGAADTLIVDAVSYLLSTISVAFVQRAFASYGETYKDKHNFLSDAREGIHYLFNHSLIRRLAVLASIINLWGEAVFSVLLYHMRNELHIGYWVHMVRHYHDSGWRRDFIWLCGFGLGSQKHLHVGRCLGIAHRTDSNANYAVFYDQPSAYCRVLRKL